MSKVSVRCAKNIRFGQGV